ncbi:MAG: sialate O-acetylesterase [Defluviitaleaceae bacterium]|nr:sialate O-acetylesterase [Defluviitaleaceae bacterium]
MSKKLLANIFTDGVVLQRDMPIKIWGKVEPGLGVTIKFEQEMEETTADKEGKWEVTLPARPVGGPYQLTVSSEGKTQEVHDILMGDVWICSGQSNMELPMIRTRRMFEAYNKTANNPNIRKYHVPMNFDFQRVQDDIPEASWIKVEPGQTEKFTATGFFFANKLYEETGVPIGLILSALGGTPIESWMSRAALSDDPKSLSEADQCCEVGYMEKRTIAGQTASDHWYEQLNKFDRGIHEKWYEEDVDDHDWKPTDLTVPWDEVTDLRASGSIWFRKEIEVSEELANQSADLILGCIVDADEVYVNGRKIGATGYRYPPRDYPVPHLKVGKNIIAIRVIAVHGMGAFVFDKAHHLLFADETKISLSTGWTYKRALSCQPLTEGPPFFQNVPTGNYQGMIAPLHNLSIKGVIWYQGESNAGHPEGYHHKFKNMITDWRQSWQQGDFPFLFVQLANWGPKGPLMHWELLRDEQTKALELPHTRMVVTYDVGEHNDLHPLNKKAVGERLAQEALSLAYGKDIVSTGPTLTSIQKSGNQLSLSFETSGSDLTLKKGKKVCGLSVWVDELEIPVEGTLNGTTVVIEAAYAHELTAVSYAWLDDPVDANLYNGVGLPAVPFKKEI